MAAVSAEAKANERRRNRESYAWYKSKGICPKCKTLWAAPGRVFCEGCLKKKRLEYAGKADVSIKRCKTRRERLKAQGLCVNCGKPAVDGRVLCAACARKNIEAEQVRKMRKRIVRENAKKRQEMEAQNGNGHDS